MKKDQILPVIFAIFGGSGDLTWRKLMPSIFNLYQDKNLPSKFSIIILDRSENKDEDIRQKFRDGIDKFSRENKVSDNTWTEFVSHISFIGGDFTRSEIYSSLKDKCEKTEKDWNEPAMYVFYMATPPGMFGVIPTKLKEAGLAKHNEKTRIVVEKPIGHDLGSAQDLNKVLTGNFRESQIFRIDHYLGKETVQNILAFRFANPMVEPIWNRHYVDYISITVAEDIGIEHRGSYYDHAGAMRDMIQNHLLQILCLIAMEPMVSFDADEIRNKKADVLHAVRPIPADRVDEFAVRGQYGSGTKGGKKIKAYRQESGVSPDSDTETFAALKLNIDNWRWQDVPFYLRTGKRLAGKTSEVRIHFRSVPHKSFPPDSTSDWESPSLVISIQPEEGIVMNFLAKQPGPHLHLKPVAMLFNYQESFLTRIPDAYETLLWDIINDDATLFMRSDQVVAAWQIIMPVLDAWSVPPENFPDYKAGSQGPSSVERILEKGHKWATIEED